MNRILILLALMALQVMVFNHLDMGLYLFPQVFILSLIALPPYLRRSYQYLIAFTIGMTMDFFTSTPGLSASGSLFLVFVRGLLLRRYDLDELIASRAWITSSYLGSQKYILYLLPSVLIYHFYIFALQAIPHLHLVNYLLTAISSSLMAFIILLLTQSMLNKGRA